MKTEFIELLFIKPPAIVCFAQDPGNTHANKNKPKEDR
jgi:hypothetical protein